MRREPATPGAEDLPHRSRW